MKKLLVFGMAALLVIAFCVPASALENVFGGYWRVRGYDMGDFDGSDTGALDTTQTTTRTRLYYTAILNDNLKLVNKFEMDAVFGGQGTYGDFGADQIAVEVKNSYADFNTGPLNWKLGVQGAAIGRSLVFDNDFSGAQALYRADAWWLRGTWLKAFEGGTGDDQNDLDYDAVAVEAAIKLGEAGDIRPYIVYSWSKEFVGGAAMSGVSNRLPAGQDDADITWLGVDADFNLGPVVVFGSAAFVTGTIDDGFVTDDADVEGFVLLAGGSVPLGPASIHGEIFYASGDDDLGDTDLDGWVGLSDSYYWAEIMGFGTFDDVAVSAGSPGDKLTNIVAANIGATIKPFDKLSLTGDIWWAQLVEDESGPGEEDELGVEVDLKITYELVEGLNLDLIGAYLFAGDATSLDGDNEENPYEIGFQTSLSF